MTERLFRVLRGEYEPRCEYAEGIRRVPPERLILEHQRRVDEVRDSGQMAREFQGTHPAASELPGFHLTDRGIYMGRKERAPGAES